MPQIKIQTTQNIAIGYTAAAIGSRVLAYMLDYGIRGLFAVGMMVLLARSNQPQWVVILIGLVPFLLYPLVCELFLNGQTIGKYVFKLRVIRLDGDPCSFGNYLLRWLLGMVENEMFFGSLSLLVLLFNRNYQRLGDIGAGTVLVQVPRTLSLEATLYAAQEALYEPVFSAVKYLNDRDVQTVRDVLAVLQKGQLENAPILALKTKRALEQKMQLQSNLPPLDFLNTVLKDYNHVFK